jgi:hypothetical protein
MMHDRYGAVNVICAVCPILYAFITYAYRF